MKKLSSVSVLLLAGLAVLACKHDSKSGVKDEIPGTYSDTAFLGQAYDSTKKKLYNVACVGGAEVAGVGNSSSELTITTDMDYQSLIHKLDGDLSATVAFPAVSAGASAKLALDSQYDNRSETHNIIWIGVNRNRVFKPNTLALTAQGKKYSTAYQAVLQDKCGDEFIKQIQYGASLFATLKVEYLNSSDKFEIGGSLNVSAKEIVKVDANAQFVNAKLAKRTKVSVIAKQFGGNPAGLLTIIPKGIVTCSFDNMQPCIDAFNNIVEYAANKLAPELTGSPATILVQDASGNIVDSAGPPLPPPDVSTASTTTSLPGGSITDTTTTSTASSSSSTTIPQPSRDGGDNASPTTPSTFSLVDDTSAWNILKYTTARYDESGFEQLRPISGWSTVDATTKRRRADLQDRYVAETDMFNRANFLLNSASGYIGAAQLAVIQDIKAKTEANINTLVDAQIQCLNDPQHCTDLAETILAALAPVDKSKLDIEVDQKRTIGNYNYYNIVGGLVYGGQYDDTHAGDPSPVVTRLRFATTSQTTSPTAGASATPMDVHLTGVTVMYANGKTSIHGNMNLGQTQDIDLSNDKITQFKIFFTSEGTSVTPRITGLSIISKAGVMLTVGATAASFGSFVIPDNEIFVGFVGSSGAEVDSLGIITRSL